MIFSRFAVFLTLSTFAYAGGAVAAPRTTVDGVRPAQERGALDRAALFRPAQIGECGAISRSDGPAQHAAVPGRPSQGKHAQHAQRTAAGYGCSVVWSD